MKKGKKLCYSYQEMITILKQKRCLLNLRDIVYVAMACHSVSFAELRDLAKVIEGFSKGKGGGSGG